MAAQRVKLFINRASDVPIRDQLVAQIELQVATRELPEGTQMLATESLGRLLGISKNTVSEAYSTLVNLGVLARRRGARLTVRSVDTPAEANTLDAILNEAVGKARNLGFTPKQFREYALSRLAKPPLRLLVVSREARLAALLRAELNGLPWPVSCCTLTELKARPDLADDSLVLGHASIATELMSRAVTRQPVLILRYNPPSDCVRRIGELKLPSLIALISVSPYTIETARLIFSPHAGDVHTLCDQVVDNPSSFRPIAGDLLFCDLLVHQGLTERERARAVLYRIISDESIVQIREGLEQ